MQLLAFSSLTTRHVTSTATQHETVDHCEASTTETVLGQLHTSTAGVKDTGRRQNAIDNSDTSVVNTLKGSSAPELLLANSVVCDQEVVLSSCNVTEPPCTSRLADPVNDDAKWCGSISLSSSASPRVSWVKPATVVVSHVKMLSCSRETLAAGCSGDEVAQVNSVISETPRVPSTAIELLPTVATESNTDTHSKQTPAAGQTSTLAEDSGKTVTEAPQHKVVDMEPSPTAAQTSSAVMSPTGAQISSAVLSPTAARSSSAVMSPAGAQTSSAVLSPTAARSSSAVMSPAGAQTISAVMSLTGSQMSSAVMSPAGAQMSSAVMSLTDSQTSSAVMSPAGAQTSSPVMSPTGAQTSSAVMSLTGSQTSTAVMSPTGAQTSSAGMSPTGAQTISAVMSPTGAQTSSAVMSPAGAQTSSAGMSPTGAQTSSALMSFTGAQTSSAVMSLTGVQMSSAAMSPAAAPVSLCSAATSATTTLGCSLENVTNAVNVLISLRALNKSRYIGCSDTAIAAVSPCRKRAQRGSTKSSEKSDANEKRTKCAKLDESSADLSAAATPAAGSKDVISTDKMTGLTDSQRVSCYKTIGAREERARVIGLKAAERLRQKTSPVTRSATSTVAESSSVLDKSEEPRGDESGGGSRSLRKPARRVPLVTVSTELPMTPTLFTLRSRARLAAQSMETRSMTQDSQHAEAGQSRERSQSDVRMKSLTEAAGNNKLTRSSSDVQSAKLKALSVVSQTCQSGSLREADKVTRSSPCKLQDHRTHGRQSLSSQKQPTPPSTSVAVTCGLETPQSRRVSVKSSNTVSKSDGGSKVTVPEIKPGDHQLLNTALRSSTRKCVVSDASETVVGGSVQSSQHNGPSSCEPNSVPVKVSDSVNVSKQTSAMDKTAVSARGKSQPTKLQQTAAQNGVELERNGPNTTQKETVLDAGSADTVSAVSGQNMQRRSSHTTSVHVKQIDRAKQRDVSVSEATSQLPNHADTSPVYSQSSGANCQQITRKTSSRTNIFHATVLDQAAKQTVSESCASKSAGNSNSSVIGLSVSGRKSVDLFDVAIAGTPAQYISAEDSSDSVLSSPFNSTDHVVVNAACENVACAVEEATEFTVANIPAGQSADISLCGEYLRASEFCISTKLCCKIVDSSDLHVFQFTFGLFCSYLFTAQNNSPIVQSV